jgi:hypothetical protein
LFAWLVQKRSFIATISFGVFRLVKIIELFTKEFALCALYSIIIAMMEAAGTSETSVNFR